jgi:hypothetical protein
MHVPITLSSVACRVLPHISILSKKMARFSKKNLVEHKMCVLIFSANLSTNMSHSKKNSAGHNHKSSHVFMYRVHYSCHIFIKLEYS